MVQYKMILYIYLNGFDLLKVLNLFLSRYRVEGCMGRKLKVRNRLSVSPLLHEVNHVGVSTWASEIAQFKERTFSPFRISNSYVTS